MADSNAGSKLYIAVNGSNSPDPQNSALNLGGYQGLTWLEVANVGAIGETGSNTNILTYDTWGEDVVQKAAGQTNAGDPTVELAFSSTDLGQIALRAAAAPANRANNYAFKIQHLGGWTKYNRAIVTGPVNSNGRNEDFQLQTFTLACNQEEITEVV